MKYEVKAELGFASRGLSLSRLMFQPLLYFA